MLLSTPALHAVEEDVTPPKKLSSVSLLPDGSQLHNVMFPRYDKSHRLIGVLKSSAMTLVNSNTIAGDNVVINFFNADQTPRGRVELDKAVFDQTLAMVKTVEPVSLQSDRLNAKGTGLYYSFEQGKGYLLGPITTWILNPTETTMNLNHPPLRKSAIIGMSLLTLPLLAVPPPVVSPEEHEAIKADVASKAGVT
ncbi:MAG: hypothetical protein H8M99_00840, partial [Gloeobacteraceae cyanobacterium ES-bin-144]|nr:hypothetical protein [Verrucomicrobiales bacterium]